jgi:hypothetical protein
VRTPSWSEAVCFTQRPYRLPQPIVAVVHIGQEQGTTRNTCIQHADHRLRGVCARPRPRMGVLSDIGTLRGRSSSAGLCRLPKLQRIRPNAWFGAQRCPVEFIRAISTAVSAVATVISASRAAVHNRLILLRVKAQPFVRSRRASRFLYGSGTPGRAFPAHSGNPQESSGLATIRGCRRDRSPSSHAVVLPAVTERPDTTPHAPIESQGFLLARELPEYE